MVNLVTPAVEAVKMSPAPLWSTRRDAKEVDPEREATGSVPPVIPSTLKSRVARGEVGPATPIVVNPPVG